MMVASNHTIATALEQGSVGVSFGGAGFLIFYYIGIVDILSKLGVVSASSKIAGASSGALITASQCSGLGTSDILKSAFDLADACRGEQSCSGSLDRQLKKLLQVHLPPDGWLKCRNNGFLAISSGTPIGDSQPLLVTDFRSQDDFITAAITSSFIPLWSGSGLFRLFRGLPAFDGGWTMSQPCPPDVKYCIRISSRNPSWPQNRGIGGFLSMIGRVGNSYTESSNTESGATPKKRAAKIVSTGPNGQPDLALVQLAAQNNMDIAPGVFHRVPFTQSQWSDWALSPAENINLISMYELGKADAAAWVEYVGIGQGVEGGAARETQGGTAMGGKGITKESKAQQAAEKPVRKLLK